MDFEKMFSENIIRQVSTIVIPGAISITPFIIWALGIDNTSISAISSLAPMFGCTLLAIAAGIVIDDISIRFEAQVLDTIFDFFTKKRHTEEWDAYLLLSVDKESLLHKTIDSTVAKMRFESAVSISIIWFLIWSSVLDVTYNIPETSRVGARLFLVGLALYTGFEATSSAKLLSKRRHDLLDLVGKLPAKKADKS